MSGCWSQRWSCYNQDQCPFQECRELSHLSQVGGDSESKGRRQEDIESAGLDLGQLRTGRNKLLLFLSQSKAFNQSNMTRLRGLLHHWVVFFFLLVYELSNPAWKNSPLFCSFIRGFVLIADDVRFLMCYSENPCNLELSGGDSQKPTSGLCLETFISAEPYRVNVTGLSSSGRKQNPVTLYFLTDGTSALTNAISCLGRVVIIK